MVEPFGIPASCETLAALFLSPITAGQICNIAWILHSNFNLVMFVGNLIFKVLGLFFFLLYANIFSCFSEGGVCLNNSPPLLVTESPPDFYFTNIFQVAL